MKKCIIPLIALTFFFNATLKAQVEFSKRSSTIKAFVFDVFKEKKGTGFIIKNYMQLSSDSTLSALKKEGVINAMIDTLVKRNGDLLSSSKYEMFAYNDFNGVKKDFNINDANDIMILSIENKPIIYFYFIQDKINSFFTIEKGSLSFFVTI